ncbi:hypothetical protein ACWGBV_03430 [Streptomyces sp. NPDC055051]
MTTSPGPSMYFAVTADEVCTVFGLTSVVRYPRYSAPTSDSMPALHTC